MGKRIEKISEAIHSRRGRNTMVFLAFVAASALLWLVQTLNEETQRDLRCSIIITNVPDTLTRITPIPEAVNVSVRAKGTQLMKYWWKNERQISIDYRQYKSVDRIQFGEAAMRAFFRNAIGNSCQIQSISPDSLSIYFTSSPGVPMPVKVNSSIDVAPQYVLMGRPHSLVDSVLVYSRAGVPKTMRQVETMPVTLSDLRKSLTVMAPIKTPAGMRAIPDSVPVRIDVEPLISKSASVLVTPVNVPEGMHMIAMPSHVEVYYMVPMSVYKKSESNPKFRVEADYGLVNDPEAERVPMRLTLAPKDFTNVFLSTDSIDFILEKDEEI